MSCGRRGESTRYYEREQITRHEAGVCVFRGLGAIGDAAEAPGGYQATVLVHLCTDGLGVLAYKMERRKNIYGL